MQATISSPAFQLAKNSPVEKLATLLWQAHRHVREGVRQGLAERSIVELSTVAAQASTDTIYGVDTIAEQRLFEFLNQHQAEAPPFILVGEFENDEAIRFGKGEPQLRVLCDPIDGTRLVMYGKSSGHILAGILPERGEETRLAEMLFSLQTEIPLDKHAYFDTLWAAPGQGAYRLRENLLTGQSDLQPLHARDSAELKHSFISFVKLFPRGKQFIAALEEDFLNQALAEEAAAPAAVFEDQHLSTSGQLYALIQGQDRLVVDIRPNLNRMWRERGEATVLCAHPYDLASWLIAQEAGAVILSPNGAAFDGAADATAEIGWIGYANKAFAARYHEILLTALRRHGVI